MIRVLIVDDHASFRESLAYLLGCEPDIAVAGAAGTLAEARGRLAGVDVAIIDLDLPDGSGLALIGALRKANPHGAALVLTASTDPLLHARAVEVGAAGVLHKSVAVAGVIDAVRRLAAGEYLLSSRELVELLHLASQEHERERQTLAVLDRLTPRERQVLQALADGLGDKGIAERLHLSGETVRGHVTHILAKLGVASRLQATLFALRHGLITVN